MHTARAGALGRLGRPGLLIVCNIQLTQIMGGDIRREQAGFDIGNRDSW